nr:hypothetical protein [Mycobacterium tuberculosis]
MIRAQAGLLEAEHQAIIRDVLTASDFWGGAGSAACQGFITGRRTLGRSLGRRPHAPAYGYPRALARGLEPPAAAQEPAVG